VTDFTIRLEMDAALREAIFGIGPHIRYVAYGNFNQVVVPTPSGHVSVCVERDADAEAVARRVADLLA
jgi:hypothetical protein